MAHRLHDSATEGAHGWAVRAFLGVTASLALVIAGVGGYGYFAYSEAQRGIRTIPPHPGSDVLHHQFGPCAQNVCNYLVLGSDSRAGLSAAEQQQFGTNKDIGGSNRSDVIMLVHTDPSLDKAIVLSFPRDLWVNIPGHGQNKINAAFEGGLQHGGAQLVASTVEGLTGLKINHVLYVDLAGFQGIVDTLGGVTMCIPANLADPATGRIQDPLTGLDVIPGCQHLNGYQALAYVRTRHLRCDFIPDFSRIARQQQFLRAVLNRMVSTSEIARAPSLIQPIARNLVTDEGFKLADIIFLVKQLQGITTGAVEFRAVPGSPAVIYPSWAPSGLDIVKMDPVDQQIFKRIRDGQPLGTLGEQLAGTPTSEANIVVPVVDHGSAGKADEVEKILSDSGFDVSPGVIPFATFGATLPGSVIAYRPGHQTQAEVVQKYFANLKTIEAPKGALKGSPVAVFVTAKYEPQPVGSGGSSSSCIAPG